ncbi:MAG: transporter substrate-binding domain-containing protein [Arcobacteraceae bacterium]
MKFFIFLSLLYSTLFSLTLNEEQKAYLKQKKEITLCVDPDWEPFEIINSKGEHEGIAADLIALVAQRLNINITLVPTKTWTETLRFSQYKMCDILSFLNDTPEQRRWLTFTEPIFSDPNVLIARNDYPMITDLSKLKATIAFPKGTAMYEKFAKDFPNLIFVPVDSEAEAFTLVENKKVDLTLRSLIVTAYTIKKEGLFNLKIVGKPTNYPNSLRMGVLKEETILRDILNLGIATLSQKDVDAIVNRHVHIVVEENNYFTIGFWVFVALLLIIGLISLWNYMLQKKVIFEVKKNLVQKELLFTQSKQAELGKLIANISHQWRDGLTKIGYINLTTMAKLKMNKPISHEYLEKSSEDIEHTLDFMSQTMQNFLEYYKPSKIKTTFEVIESIHASMSIITTKIKNHDVAVTILGESVDFYGIKNQWMQIWLNVINNSINQAIKKEIPNPTITVTVHKKYITFEDNCEGFEEEVLKNFQSEHFSGLGLKMSKDIANQEGWDIELLNTKEGAMVKVYKRLKKEQKSH